MFFLSNLEGSDFIGVSRKPKHRSQDAYIADVNVNNDAMFVLLQFFLYTTHKPKQLALDQDATIEDKDKQLEHLKEQANNEA